MKIPAKIPRPSKRDLTTKRFRLPGTPEQVAKAVTRPVALPPRRTPKR